MTMELQDSNARFSTVSQEQSSSEGGDRVGTVIVPSTMQNPPGRVSRRRTKTGCLTCRKRRIKCGEERPICNNCIKSKRQCEGYNQRVVFKVGAYRGAPPDIQRQQQQPQAQQLQQNVSLDNVRSFGIVRDSSTQRAGNTLTPIAPAPYPRSGDDYGPLGPPPHLRYHYAQKEQEANNAIPIDPQLQSTLPEISSMNNSDYHSKEDMSATHNALVQDNEEHRDIYQGRPENRGPSTNNGKIEMDTKPDLVDRSASQLAHEERMSWPDIEKRHDKSSDTGVRHEAKTSSNYQPVSAFSPKDDRQTYVSTTTSALAPSDSQVKNQVFSDVNGYANSALSPLSLYDAQARSEVNLSTWNGQEPQKMAYQHDITNDHYSLEDDTSHDIGPEASLSQLVTPHVHLHGYERITFSTFLPEPGSLAVYQPLASSTPLADPVTAKLFCHWIFVVAPCISIFERHVPDPRTIFENEEYTERASFNVFTYTVPMLALSNRLLLDSLLALSSLHAAKIANDSVTPSRLHYHLALRRLRKALAEEDTRADVETFVATLFLGYYEIMCGDVGKWSNHVQGAKNLLNEIDFEFLRQQLADYELYKEVKLEEGMFPGQTPRHIKKVRRRQKSGSIMSSITPFILGAKAFDANKIYTHSNQNQMVTNTHESEINSIEKCTLQSDMYWWFLKMDAYHALLSGSGLVLDYQSWGNCPPREHIGTLGTSYGSSDHLIIILGRIANFAHYDERRKKAAERFGPAPALLKTLQGRYSGQPYKQEPRSGPTLPSQEGLQPPSFDVPLLNPKEIEVATVEAEREWLDIRQALQVFQDSLNEEFSPLEEGLMPAVLSPFGYALFYKTYSVACLQILYKTALIILERLHPSMPSNVMVAALLALPKTAQTANEICQACAGVLPAYEVTEVSPALGGAMVELTLSMFVAGVQLQDPVQRDWVIENMLNVSRLTGWGTAERVVLGCQTAWEKLAENKRGPPYTRPVLSRTGNLDSLSEEENRYILSSAASRAHFATGVLGEFE